MTLHLFSFSHTCRFTSWTREEGGSSQLRSSCPFLPPSLGDRQTLHRRSLSSALTGVATQGGGGSGALCSLRASRLCPDRFRAHGSAPRGRQPAGGAVLPAPSAREDRCLPWSRSLLRAPTLPGKSAPAGLQLQGSFLPGSRTELQRATHQGSGSSNHCTSVEGRETPPPLQAWSRLNTCQPSQEFALHLHWDGG